MTDRTCSVEGCDRPLRSARAKWCNTHYFRWYRTGDTGSAEIWDRKPKPCSVGGCDARLFARGMCSKHYQRWKAHGDTDTVKPKPAGSGHYCWAGDDVGYTGAHDRVRRLHGSATKHACSACGGPAAHWAYDHTDPNEQASDLGPYSPDPAHYRPMCVPCHKRFDLKVLATHRPPKPPTVRVRDRRLDNQPRRRLIAHIRATQPNCHLCGLPIDLTLDRQRHPLSSCVDEIIPRRQGGDPLDAANTAHAHRVCNGSRGTKPITPEVRARCRSLVITFLSSAGAPQLRQW